MGHHRLDLVFVVWLVALASFVIVVYGGQFVTDLLDRYHAWRRRRRKAPPPS